MSELLEHKIINYFAFVVDLKRMSDAGIELTVGEAANIVQPEFGYFVAPVVFLGTYLSVNSYLIYSYVQGGKYRNAQKVAWVYSGPSGLRGIAIRRPQM